MTLLNNPVSRLVPLFYTQASIIVTLDEPDPGDVITTATFLVEWSFAMTQASYRVEIYADAGADTLVYTSGIVVSATKNHLIPLGVLSNLTNYWIVVSVTAADGTPGMTDLVQFSTSFAPSVQVTGVTIRVSDMCADAYDAPYIEIRWNNITPGAGETFYQWRILRRDPGTTIWSTIAVSFDQSTRVYRDRFPQSYLGYEYAVLWVASVTSGILISTPQSPEPTGRAKFDYAWLQSVDDPNDLIRIDAWDSEVETIQDAQLATTAGRRAPTAFVGEPLYHSVRIPPAPRLAKDSQWVSFEAFLDSQSEGTIFCLRLGKQRQKFFGVIIGSRRSNQQKSYGVGFTFTEVHYSEDVDA